MLYKKKEGIVIQIKPTGYSIGDETRSITIYDETVLVAFERIKLLYEKLENERINRKREGIK